MGWPFDSIPSVKELQGDAPPLRETLKMDKKKVDDCLSCRLMGSGAFIGLGAYSYLSGHHQMELQKKKIMASKSLLTFQHRQKGITGISGLLVMVGIWRLLN